MHKGIALVMGMLATAAWAGQTIYKDYRNDPHCPQMSPTDASYNTYCRDYKRPAAGVTCKLQFSGTQPTSSSPASYLFKLKGVQSVTARFELPKGGTTSPNSVKIQDLAHPASSKPPGGIVATPDGFAGKVTGKFFSVTLTAGAAANCLPASFTVDGR